MLTKAIIIIMMLIILGALASGLVFLARDEGVTNKTLTALNWRIGLSLILFIVLFVAFGLYWIAPHTV